MPNVAQPLIAVQVGGTAFVLTGVIGECNRDGFRQSRLLKGAPPLLHVGPSGLR